MKSRKFRNNSEGNLLNQYQEKNALLNINQDNPQNKQVLFPTHSRYFAQFNPSNKYKD